MYKDEMIQMHQFLVYVLKYLAEDDQIKNDCSEYITLKISPHHIHKTKAEHKHAIAVNTSAGALIGSFYTFLYNIVLTCFSNHEIQGIII